MKLQRIQIEFAAYDDHENLSETEVSLIESAKQIAQKSYSPYSKFPVGAAVLLDNGEIFAGNNQENIAYPSGTCAERTVLNYVHANYPQQKIKVIAVTALNSNSSIPITPCGFCRQVIVEMEQNQQAKIKVILHKIGGPTYVFDDALALLPLAFEDAFLKQ